MLKAFEHSYQEEWEKEVLQKEKLKWVKELEERKQKRKERSLVVDFPPINGL